MKPGGRTGKARSPRHIVTAVALVASGAWTSPALAQTYTGQQIDAAARQSISVMKEHIRFLSIQDRYASTLGYLNLNYRFAPVRVAYTTGELPKGRLERLGMMVGGGFGRVDKLALFFGATVDAASMIHDVDGKSANRTAAESMVFAGVGVYGLQATYSFMVRQQLEVDRFGNFGRGSEGTPASGMDDNVVNSRSEALSLYHTSGASLFATISYRLDERSQEHRFVSSVRGQLQPLTHWLGRRAGLPMIAVQKLADEIGSYGELPSKGSGADLASSATNAGDPYEIEVGSDDLLDLEIRAHAVMRVSPEQEFRRAELGWYRDISKFTLAIRGQAFKRYGELKPSVDAFARFRLGNPKVGKVGWPFSVSLNYSYNTPDSATFLPLAYAHVFGFELTVGVPDLARATVPVVRARDDDKKVSEGGEK